MDNLQNTSQPNLYEFASLLIKKAGFDKLPENFRNDLEEQIVDESIKRLGMMIIAELPEDKLNEYTALVGASANPINDPKITDFVSKSIVDFPKKFIQVLTDYSKEFTEEAQKALAK